VCTSFWFATGSPSVQPYTPSHTSNASQVYTELPATGIGRRELPVELEVLRPSSPPITNIADEDVMNSGLTSNQGQGWQVETRPPSPRVRGASSAGPRFQRPDVAAPGVLSMGPHGQVNDGAGPLVEMREPEPASTVGALPTFSGRGHSVDGKGSATARMLSTVMGSLVPQSATVAPAAANTSGRWTRRGSVQGQGTGNHDSKGQHCLRHGHLMDLVDSAGPYKLVTPSNLVWEPGAFSAAQHARGTLHPYHASRHMSGQERSISLDRRPRMSSGSLQKQSTVSRNRKLDGQLETHFRSQGRHRSKDWPRGGTRDASIDMALGLASAMGSSAVLSSQRRAVIEALQDDLDQLCRVTNAPIAVPSGLAASAVQNPLFAVLSAPTADAMAHRLQPHLQPDFKCAEGHMLLSRATAFNLAEDLLEGAKNKVQDEEEGPVAPAVLGMSESAPVRRQMIAITRHPAFDPCMAVAIVIRYA
jgi:hypothetical protein